MRSLPSHCTLRLLYGEATRAPEPYPTRAKGPQQPAHMHCAGLKGDETNPVDLNDASRGSVKVFPGAPYVAKEQPRHGYAPYQAKLDIVNGTPRMDGFVDYERSVHPWWALP